MDWDLHQKLRFYELIGCNYSLILSRTSNLNAEVSENDFSDCLVMSWGKTQISSDDALKAWKLPIFPMNFSEDPKIPDRF